MKKYTFLLFSVAYLFFFSACDSEPKEKTPSEREQLYKEVMEIHDAVMPKMADLNRLKRNLKAQIKADSTISDSIKTLVNVQLGKLSAAEDGMTDWMRDFKAPKKSDPDEKIIAYLKTEKINISRVSDLMLENLKNGKALLDQLKTQQTQTPE